MFQKYDVRHVLAGHTHTTQNVTWGNLSIYTVAGTARAFDDNGCGYRVLRMNATGIEAKYVRQDDPSLAQCTRTSIHPDFADQPNLSKTWANVSWLLD